MLPVDPAAVPPFCARGARRRAGCASPRSSRPATRPADAGRPAARPRRRARGRAAGRRRGRGHDGARGRRRRRPSASRAPRMHVIHDRRPPGLDRVVGAPGANAGLLHGADGWRAVVLPSLGDIAADLGDGPGRDPRRRAPHRGRRWRGASRSTTSAPRPRPHGTRVRRTRSATRRRRPGGRGRARPSARPAPPPATGRRSSSWSPPRTAPRLAALPRRRLGQRLGARLRRAPRPWAAPIADRRIDRPLAPTATLVALGTPRGRRPRRLSSPTPRDGAAGPPRRGRARLIAPAPEPGTLLVAGDWGCAWLTPLEEDS